MRSPAGAGYRKGDETQRRLLDAALKAFGEEGFAAVTTRRIADAAGVALPALQYYFGGKEGLYRACAEAIVERYRIHTAEAAAEASQDLGDGCSGEAARTRLKALVSALAGLLVGSTETEAWTQFATRELRNPGPAFEILYDRLWRPGVEITARLIARILGVDPAEPPVRLQALMLISSLMAFQSGRAITFRTMDWSAVGPEQRAMVLSILNGQIDAIGVGAPQLDNV